LPYRIDMSREALHDLRRLRDSDILRISTAIRGLEENPLPVGVKRLRGAPFWRIRVGEDRVIYSFSQEQQVVYVEGVLRRYSKTYRRFDQ
jgi:mRNA interferase RelE/StbE